MNEITIDKKQHDINSKRAKEEYLTLKNEYLSYQSLLDRYNEENNILDYNPLVSYLMLVLGLIFLTLSFIIILSGINYFYTY